MNYGPCPLRDSVLACDGHALVVGGPGSGKTTLALRKAILRIKNGVKPGQTILFISFSRAAVTRVIDAAKTVVPHDQLALISVQTFHSFFWDLLRPHGYLIGAPRKLSILLPQDERALSGGVKEHSGDWPQWEIERERLFRIEGKVAFDLFARNTVSLLEKSNYLLQNIALKHPFIIIDEAQDTSDDAWRCIELLASYSQILCLADLEQQIFDFLPGVGPERIQKIRTSLNPLDVDLGSENHRSPDTEILAFANDVLTSNPRGNGYQGVAVIRYRAATKAAPLNFNHLLRRALGQLYKEIRADGKGGARTICILAMNKDGALKISNSLNGLFPNVGKVVKHKLLFDEAEALLTARFAAFLLEPKLPADLEKNLAAAMELLAAAKRSTGNGKVAVQTLLAQAAKIRAGKALNINIAKALRSTINRLHAEGFTGNPSTDWLAVKYCLRISGQAELVHAAQQLDYLVAFHRGKHISAALASDWQENGAYSNARAALDIALAQEQLMGGLEEPMGIQVMNVHKAKGKQFDGVIFVREPRMTRDGTESSFIWRGDVAPYPKSRRLIRVGATRARRRLIILDPFWPACPILSGHRL